MLGDDGRLRLYCFHHAGAGSLAFGPWQDLLGPRVEVVPVLLPGRDARFSEPRITDLNALHRELRTVVDHPADRPYALYGHSMGGLIAHHVAAHWRRFAAAPPRLTVIGASQPPDAVVPILDSDVPPEEALLELVGHSSARTLPRSALRRYVLPVLRDDLALARVLRAAARPVDVPVLAVSGDTDPLADARTMAGWARWTTGAFTRHTLPGDHYFVRDRTLTEFLAHVLEPSGTGPDTASAPPEGRRIGLETAS
ncbi:thioesterase II family protein [Streptomyces sp. CoH27]|uniref:thioesterase II family protein n=1 Tax=Streptomyces sp. CoH27 TaxID=2875763 RepID=UPI001CD74020|nr:alpha/beta fold hydrolase [Streptomyces sp. CoH27]